MRNLKRLAALLMTAALILSLSVTAFAAVEDTGFSDVDANAWYAEAVMYCREHGLMNGTSSTTFEPESNLTRAMVVTVLYRSAGSPAVTGSDNFTDTVAGAYYANAVLWASQQGLVNGYGNGLFGTNDPITQRQMELIFQRYTQKPVTENIPGFDGSSRNATRAQVAAALMNLTRDTQSAPAPDTTSSGGARVLVAYFSGSGTTRGVAQNIVAALGSNVSVLHEITPEQPYTTADLDYTNSNCRSVTEQHDPSARPAIANSVTNMSNYDIVFLGYPIWNNDAPRIIYTFLESENLSGKTIVPFCTSGGSGIANSVSNIQGLASGATWTTGRRCSSADTVSTLASWANGLGLDFAPAASTATPTPRAYSCCQR